MTSLLVAVRAALFSSGFLFLWTWVALAVEDLDGRILARLPEWAVVPGLVVMALGAALALSCIAIFVAVGRGTPAPFDAPRRFVAVGPYRLVRNPMYVGGFLVLAGWALYRQSPSVLLFAAAWLGLAHLFVLGYEEPTLRDTFGADYERYLATVPRWIPLRRGRQGSRIGRRIVAALLIVLPSVASAVRAEETGQDDAGAGRLAAGEKAQTSEALRLQAALGDRVWPGFDTARIPVILYDDRWQFLIGAGEPPAPWVVVEGDSFQGAPYHRRPASQPAAFAVRVGNGWAGSMSTLERMGRRAPFKPDRGLHAAMILHEMFHAYQAGQAPERFAQALKVYAVQTRYHARQQAHAAAWDKEGSLLAAALRARDEAGVRQAALEFLRARDGRRGQAALEPDLLAYEGELEWLEGLAKYVEIRFQELAASGDSTRPGYGRGLGYWHWDFSQLEAGLGRQDGDGRFYPTGMAQARLLDVVSPVWKASALRSGVNLDDLLRAAVAPAAR